MGKLKISDDEMSVEELDVEWEDKDYVKYEGEIPPSGTVVNGCLKKAWWTYSSDNTPMIKVLFEADETAGEYEGLPIWENLVLKPSCAFRYGPWLEFFGLTLKDVKNKTYVSDTDDSNGAPIEKIAGFEPGSDDAYCAVATKRSKYQGEWKAEVGEWLEYDPDREAEEEEEEPPPARPTRSARATSKPAASANGKAPTKTRARAAVKEAVEEAEEAEEEAEEEEEEARPTKPARSSVRSRVAAKPAAQAKPAVRGRRAAAKDDLPF